MVSEKKRETEKKDTLYLKLWLVAIAGLVIPPLAVHFWPDRSWAAFAESAFQASQTAQAWQEPWVSIDQKGFGPGWVRCASLEDALELDKRLDDGHLHSGKLILAEGGLAWRQ